MAEIQCRNCGKLNPPELIKCQFCQLPLQAMDDEDETIRPGQIPTKRVTAELEPILPQWLREAREKSRKAAEEEAARQAAEAAQAADREQPPDLLAGLEAQSRGDEEDEVPDWLAGMQGGSPRASERIETYPRRQEIRWEEETAEAEPEEEMGGLVNAPQNEVTFDESGLPSWITGGPAEKEEAPAPAPDEEPVSPFDTGSFRPNTGELADFLPEDIAPPSAPAPSAAPGSNLPDWLSNLPPISDQPGGGTPALVDTGSLDLGPKPTGDLPDWMANLDSAFASSEPAPESPSKPDAFKLPADLPDWMKSAGGADESKPVQEERGAFLSPLPPSEEISQPPPISSSPAFFPGMEPVSEDEVSELFAAELPEWLANVAPAEPKREPQAADASISPGDLPSWVQAMRPVESVLPEAQAAPTTPAGPAEQQGPLAGLSGVLPILPGLGPSRRPTAYSNMLQASEDQQSNAALLEKLLASETEPEPLASSSSTLLSQRVLRWTITIILLLLVIVISLSGSQVTPLPILPAETFAAINAVNGIPNDSPILIVFDYEPSLSGEVEAAAASLVDNLILLRHPRLTLLSTSLNGPALAEHFMATTQSQHAYLAGTNYVNLGYLPGGTAGVLGFAEAPRVIMPRSINGTSVWSLPPGLNIKTIADYAAVIVLTDQAETARVWIEQAGPLMNGRPMLMVTSAQAGPMLQPYVLSGQLAGMVSGLAGGASVEQAAVRPGLSRQYWDAFGLTMLIVVLMIFIGSAWSLVVGMRDRSRGEA